jgi:hypothetical protein
VKLDTCSGEPLHALCSQCSVFSCAFVVEAHVIGESDLSSGATRHMRIIWLLSSSVSFRSYVMSVVVCTCVCSCLRVRQSSILTAFSDRPKWRIGPAHGGIVPATSTATWRPISAVFPLFSRCVPAGSTTIKRQEEPRGIGRKSVCVCHVKLMHHHHVSGRCVPVSKCVSRAFSDRLPSKMADRPPYRNESSVHAPFPYITRRAF